MEPIESAQLESRLPILMTGITGVAGYNAFLYLRQRYPGRVLGIRPHVTWRLNGEGIVAQDVDDPDGIGDLFRRYRFRSVLNCVGSCALKAIECDKRLAYQVNVVSAKIMAENVTKYKARLVHLSSDMVFSGTRGGKHVESDPVDPVSMYGKTMVMAERVLLAKVPGVTILRISLPMGPSFNTHAGAIDWIESRFRKNRPATLYFDEVRSPTYCDDMNIVFEYLLANDVPGLFHFGGPKYSSLYQIAQIVNRVGGYDSRLLKGCPRVMAGPIPPRAGNVTMRSDKLIETLGTNPFRPWPLDPQMYPTDRDWHARRELEEVGSKERIAKELYTYCPEQVV